MRYAALALILTGCAHPTFDLRAHEEGHCRAWGVHKSLWRYHYLPDARKLCQQKTGLVFIDACAELHVGRCDIYLPRD